MPSRVHIWTGMLSSFAGRALAAHIALTFLAWADSFDYAAVESAISDGQLASAAAQIEARLKNSPSDARAHLLAGIVLSEGHDIAGARSHFLKAAQLAPKSASPHSNLGKLLALEGKFYDAQHEFERAVALEPRDAGARSNFGLFLLANRRYQAAEEQFSKAVELSPRDVDSRLALLEAQGANHRFNQARETARQVLFITPDRARMLQAVGALQVQFGDYAGAIDSLTQAVELAPGVYEAAYNLGLAYDRSGNSRSAEAVLGRLEKRSPNPELKNLLGSVYEENQKPVDAIRSFQEAAEAEPKNESYRFDYICELINHLNYEAAELIARPASVDFPQSMRMRLALSISLFGHSEFAKAQELFVATARQFPESDLPLQIITFAPDTSDMEIPETISLLEARHNRHPHSFLPLYFLGHVAMRNGDSQRAITFFEESLRLSPAHARTHYELGRAYSDVGNEREAIQAYEQALKLDPKLLEAQYRLSLSYKRAGDRASATDALNKLKQLQDNAQKEVIHRFLYSMR